MLTGTGAGRPLAHAWAAGGSLASADRRARPARLQRTQLTVWSVDLAVGEPELLAAAAHLSPPELARADRCAGPVRQRKVVLRAALRELLGSELGVAPRDVPLSGRPGRPALEVSAGRPDLDLSCSASGGLGLVAMARDARIGVDVQTERDEDLETSSAEGWLAPEEVAAIAALPSGERPRALTRAWVQKESVLKGQGVGLWADLSRARTPLADRGRMGDWWLAPLDVPAGWVAAVAVKPARSRPHLRPVLRGPRS